MEAEKKAIPSDKTYEVIEVEKTEPPHNAKGDNWYRYVIALEGKTIVGNRRGTLKQVTEHAHECADNLSARTGRGPSPWSYRKKK